MEQTPTLARRLTQTDAVLIGLGSMIGAGVFAAFAPAAASSGSALLIGLGIAGLVAFCSALASAQLAAQYPTSGGSYTYGRDRLGEWPGFLAGWTFVIGKTASCAAMALTFAAYAVPPEWQKPTAALAVAGLAAVNYLGVTRTAWLTRVIVGLVLVVLLVVLIGGWVAPDHQPIVLGDPQLDWYGILQSGALLFFAFAGFARIATMGEEVIRPERTIPRAISIALGLVLVIYLGLAVTSLSVLGPRGLAESSAPLVEVATAGLAWSGPVVVIGAAVAALGALLALIAGIGRTALAMARNDDLPRWLAAVHPKYRVPHRAEVALALVVVGVVLLTDVREAIGFSSFGVLLYYLIANLSAATQTGGHRRYPRVLQFVGAAGCLVLAATLPWESIVAGLAVVALGVGYRLIRLRLAA